MLIKQGVDISRLERNTRRSLGTVDRIHAELGVELVITSTYDRTHSAGSLHYANQAYDIRYPECNAGELVEKLKSSLGQAFDVVAEFNHIHIEYDPK